MGRYTNIMLLAKESEYKKIKVKRDTWGNSWCIVNKVCLKQNGKYGLAYGHIEYSNGNFVDGEIPCAGNYSWRTVEVLSEEMDVEKL